MGNPRLIERITAAGGEGMRMLVVTVASFVAGFALTMLGKEVFGLEAELAYSIAILLCTVANFFACRYYVFRTSRSPILPEALRFFPSVIAFRFLEIALFSLFARLGLDYRLAYIATSVISLMLKFLVAKYFVFKSHRN